jgi:hypothetical protein
MIPGHYVNHRLKAKNVRGGTREEDKKNKATGGYPMALK